MLSTEYNSTQTGIQNGLESFSFGFVGAGFSPRGVPEVRRAQVARIGCLEYSAFMAKDFEKGERNGSV